MKPKEVAVVVAGPFEDFELASLIALVRFVDGQHADRHYSVIICDPDSSLGEAEQALRAMMPERPDRKTEFSVHRKQ